MLCFLIPVFQHAFTKADMAPWRDRVAMLRVLADGDPNLLICTIEQELGEVSYTHRTLGALQTRYPGHEFRWIVGGDSALPSCFQALSVRGLGGHYYEEMLSSALVRSMIRNGKDIAWAVGEGVAIYIRDHGLYQKEKEE